MSGIHLKRVHTSLGDVELYTFRDHAHAFPRHSHDVLTLGVLDEGNGTIKVREGASVAHAGGLLALAPDEVHSAEPARGHGWTYRSLCPSLEWHAHLADGESLDGFAFGQAVIDDTALARELGAVHSALSANPADLATEERLLSVLRTAVHRYGLRRSESLPAARRQAIERARAYIEAHLGAQVRLADLSATAELSAFQLIRAFRAAYGVPPHAYQTQLRAERARVLLRAGEPITSVAYACGFVDQSHLTRVFKRHFGLTPGAYQRA